jgi:hypothetical protein
MGFFNWGGIWLTLLIFLLSHTVANDTIQNTAIK